MKNEDVAEFVREFLVQEILEGSDVELEPTTPLLEHGLLNSMGVLLLLDRIHERFGVTIPRGDIKPENLQSIAAIAAMITRARGAG